MVDCVATVEGVADELADVLGDPDPLAGSLADVLTDAVADALADALSVGVGVGWQGSQHAPGLGVLPRQLQYASGNSSRKQVSAVQTPVGPPPS